MELKAFKGRRCCPPKSGGRPAKEGKCSRNGFVISCRWLTIALLFLYDHKRCCMFMLSSSPTLPSNHHHPRQRKLRDTSPYRPFLQANNLLEIYPSQSSHALRVYPVFRRGNAVLQRAQHAQQRQRRAPSVEVQVLLARRLSSLHNVEVPHRLIRYPLLRPHIFGYELTLIDELSTAATRSWVLRTHCPVSSHQRSGM